ncbi:MAG: rhombosortase [Gammaproteobacteria bacterium]|nr:rhombosortase [Gammaproteobacteria bacterium]
MCALMVIAMVLALFQPMVQPALEFNHELISNGQYWRLLTGNFLHTNGWHLLFNLAGLVLLHLLFGQYFSARSLLGFTIINASSVGLLLYFFSPDITYYVGLSGYLHGLFVVGCLSEIDHGIKTSYLLLGAIAAKIYYEQTSGASAQMSELINANVAVDAHLYGAIAALPIFLVYWLYRRSLAR